MLSSISELGLSIGVNLTLGPMGLEGLENMTEAERREAEREAERRLRPYACGVGECQRRYKNMNGLRKCVFLRSDFGSEAGVDWTVQATTTSIRATTVRSDSRCS